MLIKKEQKMAEKIDFKKYKYFYDGSIIRVNRETQKTEMLYNGKFIEISPKKSYEDMAKDPHTDATEITEGAKINMELLKRELTKVNDR